MSLIPTALEPYLLWIKLALIAAVLGAAAWGLWHAYSTVAQQNYDRGYNARVAEEATDSAKAKAAADWLNQLGAQATQQFHAQLDAEMPQIEETTHAHQDRIRIVYRDHPVPADCVRPAGVLRELEAARAAANAAAGAPAH